jgi:hypothetical protein
VPVLQDTSHGSRDQPVLIRSGGEPLDDLAATRRVNCLKHVRGAGRYRWPVEQDAAQMAVRPQDGSQQRAFPATDVGLIVC